MNKCIPRDQCPRNNNQGWYQRRCRWGQEFPGCEPCLKDCRDVAKNKDCKKDQQCTKPTRCFCQPGKVFDISGDCVTPNYCQCKYANKCDNTGRCPRPNPSQVCIQKHDQCTKNEECGGGNKICCPNPNCGNFCTSPTWYSRSR